METSDKWRPSEPSSWHWCPPMPLSITWWEPVQPQQVCRWHKAEWCGWHKEERGVIQRCSTWRRLQGDLVAAFQYLKGAYKKRGEQLSIRICSDRTKGINFQLKEGRFRSVVRLLGTSSLSKWWGPGCPELWMLHPGKAQGQVGLGLEPPSLVDGIPGHGQRVRTIWSSRSLFHPCIFAIYRN